MTTTEQLKTEIDVLRQDLVAQEHSPFRIVRNLFRHLGRKDKDLSEASLQAAVRWIFTSGVAGTAVSLLGIVTLVVSLFSLNTAKQQAQTAIDALARQDQALEEQRLANQLLVKQNESMAEQTIAMAKQTQEMAEQTMEMAKQTMEMAAQTGQMTKQTAQMTEQTEEITKHTAQMVNQTALMSETLDTAIQQNAISEEALIFQDAAFSTQRRQQLISHLFAIRDSDNANDYRALIARDLARLCHHAHEPLRVPGLNLTGAVFCGLDLTNADFTNADLTNVCFAGCQMAGATFSGATMSKTCLCDVDLSQVADFGFHAPDGTNEAFYYNKGTVAPENKGQKRWANRGTESINWTSAGYPIHPPLPLEPREPRPPSAERR